MAPFREADVDTVVLGCTHYPLLLESLKQSLPSVRFWVDSGEAIARRVAWLMDQAGQLASAEGQDSRTGDDPVIAALFSGPAPEGIIPFMAGIGLAPRLIREGWPGATATGSA
jgi:glutamate racemase